MMVRKIRDYPRQSVVALIGAIGVKPFGV